MVATSAEDASIERSPAEIFFKRGFITMAKLSKKWLSLLVAALLTLGAMALFTACGPTDPDTPDDPDDPGTTIDWSSYTQSQWLAELDKFDDKEISYQFNSTDFTQLNGSAVLNLYADGSACGDHYTPGRGEGDMYFGYWSEAEDEDGNAISITITSAYSPIMAEGSQYVVKGTQYPSLYELSNGNYSFSMDVDLALGQYTRQLSMVCDNTVKFDNFADFEAYAETAAPETPEEGGDEEEGAIPENALNFVYVADSSDQLQDTMICESTVWGAALGTTGNYTPTDSKDLLLTFNGGFTTIECYADGTYQFTYDSVGLVETGTWTWSNWAFTLTTAGGNTITGSVYGG